MPEIADKPQTAGISESLAKVRHCPFCGDPVIAVPVLACAHCGAERAMRSYYYKRAKGYIAECIDLDLLSQGNTPEEAIGKLQEAMFGYMKVVFSSDSTKGLVLRKSPLSHRIHYHAQRFLHKLKGRFSGANHQHLMPKGPNADETKLCHC